MAEQVEAGLNAVSTDTTRDITLPDGRRLSYAEFGQPAGRPVLYFHGAPSSRFEPLLVGDETWEEHGLRVIAPDRPGVGQSDFQLKRRFSDWPADVTALADELGLDRFAVLGMSGGGGYVAACAAKIPERLRAAVIVSGGWPMTWLKKRQDLPLPNRITWFLASSAPVLLRPLLRSMKSGRAKAVEKELVQMAARLPRADYEAFKVPGRVMAFAKSLSESMRHGTKGAAWDMRLYGREFDFRLQDVRAPITLFHGEKDTNVPVALARRGAAYLRGSRLVTYPHDAHLSTLCNHIDEIAKVLKGSS
jgi:pimeloyl-ACP methyl ester carboxylesterase